MRLQAPLLELLRRGWFPAAIVFLYTYNFPYFKGISSANELPRIYLSMAIVDRGALNIDPEMRKYQETPDTSNYKGKLYCNKAPGMSFLGVPVYLVQKLVNGGKAPDLIRTFFWFRLITAMLPTLLFLILLWRVLRYFVPDKNDRRLVLAAYALGTMALTYSTLLLAHQLSGLLLATGFCLIYLRSKGEGRAYWPLLAGLAAGGGVLVDYQVAFIGPPLFVYLLWVARPRLRSALFFCAGAALPLAALLLYQWGCFDSPFLTGYHFPTTPQFREWHSQGFLGMKRFTWVAFVGSFFSADNGLFYFSPFLLLAFPGLVLMLKNKQHRAEGLLCTSLVVFYIYFISSLTFWRSGWAVGPRYITCVLPYYVVPIAVLLARTSQSYVKGVVLGLIAVSIIIYTTANAIFPHYPENFSQPWFDLTLRFARAGYVSYNLSWLLGLSGVASLLPYLLVLGALLGALFAGSVRSPAREPRPAPSCRLAIPAIGVLVTTAVFVMYHARVSHRQLPVPVSFLPWMDQIWEPRHAKLDLKRLLPAGNPKTGAVFDTQR